MNDDLRPSVDPWDLLIEHNQRIQRLEQQVQLLNSNQGEILKAITHLHELYDVNKRTVDKVLENQQATATLIADIMIKASASSTGEH